MEIEAQLRLVCIVRNILRDDIWGWAAMFQFSGLCFYLLHYKMENWIKRISDKKTSFPWEFQFYKCRKTLQEVEGSSYFVCLFCSGTSNLFEGVPPWKGLKLELQSAHPDKTSSTPRKLEEVWRGLSKKRCLSTLHEVDAKAQRQGNRAPWCCSKWGKEQTQCSVENMYLWSSITFWLACLSTSWHLINYLPRFLSNK